MRRRFGVVVAHPVDSLSVLAWMTLVEVSVRLVPLPTLASWMGATLATTEPSPGSPAPLVAREPRLGGSELRRLRLVDALARRWPFGRGPCLRQALVAGHVLRRHGPVLRLGAALSESDVVGHAWLEVGSFELGRSDDFTALVASPRR
jgi:hypothetical protein